MVDKDQTKYWEFVNELEEINTEKAQHDEKIEPGRWVSHFKRLMHNVNMNLIDKQKSIERNLLNHKNLKTFSELDFKITPK